MRTDNDAELIALGVQFEAAWVLERNLAAKQGVSDDEVTAAVDAVGEIVDVILVTPATTLAGLRIKARAYAWCHSGELDVSPPRHTDSKLALSVIKDLLAIEAT